MCPSCEKGHLHPTGAFWVCELCGLVITQQALAFARASVEAARSPGSEEEHRSLPGQALDGGDLRETGQGTP
jgi:ribosomal protein L37AE/L43A